MNHSKTESQCLDDDHDVTYEIVGIGQLGKKIAKETKFEASNIQYVYLEPHDIASYRVKQDYAFFITDLDNLSDEQQLSLLDFEHLLSEDSWGVFYFFISSAESVKPYKSYNEIFFFNKEANYFAIQKTIQNIIEIMITPGMLYTNWLDVKFNLNLDKHKIGNLYFGHGYSMGDGTSRRAEDAARMAWKCIPESVLKQNTNCLFNIKSGLDMEFYEIFQVSEFIDNCFENKMGDYEGYICIGTTLDENMENEIEVTVIISEFIE